MSLVQERPVLLISPDPEYAGRAPEQGWPLRKSRAQTSEMRPFQNWSLHLWAHREAFKKFPILEYCKFGFLFCFEVKLHHF